LLNRLWFIIFYSIVMVCLVVSSVVVVGITIIVDVTEK
jgi:hypothetical protein